MKVSDAIVKCLAKEDVNTVFGYPGVAVLNLYESLRKSDIKHVLVRQEQSAVHSASGYARSNDKVGVCVATSGPGATNLITGIATAYMDSIPLVIITGQVETKQIGLDVFQEADITGSTNAFIKHSYLVKDPNSITQVMKEAFYIARSGRPGPVLIDVPSDIQDIDIEFEYPENVSIRGYKPTLDGHYGQIKKVVNLLKESKRPLICAGGGIILSKSQKELMDFVNISKIPVVHTLMGVGVLPTNSPYNFGMIGTHGFSHSNWAMINADTILFIGVRKANRAIANAGKLEENKNIIHIDVDPAEIGKITSANIPVVGDAKNILNKLIENIDEIDTTTWIDEIKNKINIKEEAHSEENDTVNPKLIIRILSTLLDDDAIITTDVGQNQFWTVRNIEMKGNRKILASGGFGTMGYSVPAGIGACMATNNRQIVSTCGDGSFQMSLTELATIKQEGLKPLILLFNNSGLGMVREAQRTKKQDPYGVAMNLNPDFIKLANAYGINAKSICTCNDIESSLKQALDSNEPYLLEFIVDSRESTL